jgi:hypothetical protein
MRRAATGLGVLTAAVGALALAVIYGPAPASSLASSHREAPLISEDPSADNTDLYAFRSPDKPDTLTLISNYIPGEDPAAGPNYYTFSPTARYNIYIDRNGDGKADVTYRFQFTRKTGPFFLGDTQQPYTVTKIANGKAQVIVHATTPPDNIGPRSTPKYHALAMKGVTALPGGGEVFAGQRDDPFFGDIGAIFDLLGFRKHTGADGGGKNFLAGYAVHTIALQIPISQLDTTSHVIGIWSTADRKVIGIKKGGGWVQVSRLGNPLVNEVIMPTGLKDLWNASGPAQEGRFEKYYKAPILAAVMNKLYKLGVKETDRTDLVSVFLTGVPKLNFTSSKLAEELRINLSTPVTPAGKMSRLGVLGGDVQGWPNGRRLGDDVIDIAERAVAGALIGKKIALGDGVNSDNVKPMSAFPYVSDPLSGFANTKGH